MKPFVIIFMALHLFFVSCAPTNNINRSGQILDETSQRRHDYFFEHKKSETTSVGEVILTVLAVVTIVGIVIILNDIQGEEREKHDSYKQIVVEENNNFYYGYEKITPEDLLEGSKKEEQPLKTVRKKTLFETGVSYVKITNPYDVWLIGDLTTREFDNGDLKQVTIAPHQTIKLYLPRGIRYTYTYNVGQEIHSEKASKHLFQVRKQEIVLAIDEAIAYD